MGGACPCSSPRARAGRGATIPPADPSWRTSTSPPGGQSFRSEPPSLKGGLVRRPRLLRELAGRFDRRLTIVVAGAGYGKTTLLSQSVDENRMDPNGVDAWLLASERDRTPGHLLGGLSTSLVGDPGAAISVEDLRDLVLLRAPDSVCIVIDDAHALDGSEAWDLVERLLDACRATDTSPSGRGRCPRSLRASGRPRARLGSSSRRSWPSPPRSSTIS